MITLATAIALVVAIPLDLVLEAFARQAFEVSPDFEPFQGTVAPYTAGAVVLAAVVFAVLRRSVRDAARVYVRLAIVALVLSWIPDVALLLIHDPGATVPAVASLMVMHAAAAAVVVTSLLRIAPPSRPIARS
jgi:cytochrome c biogenesis factor